MKKLYITGAIVFVLGVLALVFLGDYTSESTTQENYQGSVVKIGGYGTASVALTLLSDDGTFQNVAVHKNSTELPFKVIENKTLGEDDSEPFSCDRLILEKSILSDLPSISNTSENCQLQTADVSRYAWQ